MSTVHTDTDRFFGLVGAFNKSPHWWRAGDTAEFYFDFDAIAYQPNRCQEIVSHMADLITELDREEPLDFMAFIEKRDGGTVGAITLAGALAATTGLSFAVVRPSKEVVAERVKLPLEEGLAPNARLQGNSFVIVTDHVSRGDEVQSAAEIITALGGRVTGVVTYTVWGKRLERERFEEITLRSCHTLPDAAEAFGLTLAVNGEPASDEH